MYGVKVDKISTINYGSESEKTLYQKWYTKW